MEVNINIEELKYIVKTLNEKAVKSDSKAVQRICSVIVRKLTNKPENKAVFDFIATKPILDIPRDINSRYELVNSMFLKNDFNQIDLQQNIGMVSYQDDFKNYRINVYLTKMTVTVDHMKVNRGLDTYHKCGSIALRNLLINLKN
jgi:hypothetical protein